MARVRPRPHGATAPTAGDLGLVDALAQLSFSVQGSLARHAAAHDVTMIQARLLGVLRDRTPTMHELARLLGLDKSSVTGLVDRAERRDLVARVVGRDDRRVTRVHLTARGRRIVARVESAFGDVISDVVADLSSTEQRQLSALATRVVARARAAP